MTIRRTILFFCLLLLPLPAMAQEGARTYVIKKGDTLWGISERFIKDPYYWPDLWANNPYIRNPHFIYPGQKLYIYDGRIELVPAQPEAPAVAAAETEAAAAVPAPEPSIPQPSPAITINTMGGARGFVGTGELAHDGILVDTVDNRILMASGDRVFVKPQDPGAVRPADRFSLFETGEEVQHPVTGQPVGYQVTELGAVQITETGPQVATAVITDSFREIQRGALLLPWQPPVREIELKKAAQELSGYVIAGGEGKIALSQFDIIFVDFGAAEGLEVGNLLYISRQRMATELAYGAEELQLPEVLLGSAVVLETRPHTAAALVLKSADSMYRGDRATTVTVQ
jgi:hypothetical protein